MKNEIIEQKIQMYYKDVSKLTEDFTNDLHIMYREWLLSEIEINKYKKLLDASWYFSEYIEDKQKWPGFYDNIDILRIVYDYLIMKENKI